MRRKINYELGDCFYIPLRDHGYARGVVARMNGKGGVFGYFFGPRIESLEGLSVYGCEDPNKAIFRADVGDLGFLEGKWKVIGKISGWSKNDWPFPKFVRRGMRREKKALLVTYNDETFEPTSSEEIIVSEIDWENCVEEATYGYGAAEIKLTAMLSEQ